MTDARIRELERRWRDSGAAEDEGALLLERLRTGAVTRGRLELLAHGGSAGAAAALGVGPTSPATLEELRAWVWALSPPSRLTSDRALLVRAAVEAGVTCGPTAVLGVPSDPQWEAVSDRNEVSAAVAALQAWRARPSSRNRRDARASIPSMRALHRDVDHLVYELGGSRVLQTSRRVHLWAVTAVVQAVEALAWTTADVPDQLDAAEHAARVEAGPALQAAGAVQNAALVLDDVGEAFRVVASAVTAAEETW